MRWRPAAAAAHHGFGRFDLNHEVTFSGTLTGVDFVNPHSYIHFETTDAEGAPLSVKCELRAATLLRRSGWTEDLFVIGEEIELRGFAHRDDPTSCYVEDLQIGEVLVNRNDQFATATPAAPADRAPRTPWGAPNLAGDWAVDQSVLTAGPEGRADTLVPKSYREAYAAGAITIEEIRARTGARPTAVYTEAGQQAADAFVNWSPQDNPRLRCEPTSILFDWTFDWPVNRISQAEDRIVIDYGLITNQRVIHLDADAHPADLEPSDTGHSIGWWEDDTLVVDTVGFVPGVIAPPTRHSAELHVVERFTLDPETTSIRRDYAATDPVYLAEPYAGWDLVLVADVPWEAHPCEELTYEFSDGLDANEARLAAEAAAAQSE